GERRAGCSASHGGVSAASIQLLVPPGSPSARVRRPRPLCPKTRQTADRLSRSRCKLHFGFPEASGQTGGSRTSLTHRKHQSGLGSARPCLAAFAAPLVAASPSSAISAFTPRLSSYSLPSIGAICGGSLSR